jgi:antitoxin (DNA-binding transcriptional repressor) of toxin-antitoxin stability system
MMATTVILLGSNMTISAAVVQAKCLKLMDEVAITARPVVIIWRGTPVAQLVSVPASSRSLFGYMKNAASIKGSVVVPTGELWVTDSGNEEQLQTAAKRR